MQSKSTTNVILIPSTYEGEKEWLSRTDKNQGNQDVIVYFQRAKKPFNFFRACTDLFSGIKKANENITKILGNQIATSLKETAKVPATPYREGDQTDSTDTDKMLDYLSTLCMQKGHAEFELAMVRNINGEIIKNESNISREVIIHSLKKEKSNKKLGLQNAILQLSVHNKGKSREAEGWKIIDAMKYCIDHNNNVALYKSEKEKDELEKLLKNYAAHNKKYAPTLCTQLEEELKKFEGREKLKDSNTDDEWGYYFENKETSENTAPEAGTTKNKKSDNSGTEKLTNTNGHQQRAHQGTQSKHKIIKTEPLAATKETTSSGLDSKLSQPNREKLDRLLKLAENHITEFNKTIAADEDFFPRVEEISPQKKTDIRNAISFCVYFSNRISNADDSIDTRKAHLAIMKEFEADSVNESELQKALREAYGPLENSLQI